MIAWQGLNAAAWIDVGTVRNQVWLTCLWKAEHKVT